MSPRRLFPIAGMGALFLAVSAAFLVSLIADPSAAVRGDDYWTMSDWYHESGPWPHTHFGPGYPLLIFLLRSTGVSMLGLLLLQKAMVALMGYLIYRNGRLLGLGWLHAAVAGFAFTVFPITQSMSSLFFSETFYLLLICLAVRILLAIEVERDWGLFWRLLGALGLLGCAALVRGNSLVLMGLMTLIACFRFPLRPVIIAAVIAGLPVLGWSALNYKWYGHFKPTSSGDANIAASLVGPVMAKVEGKPIVSGPKIWIPGDWREQSPNQFEFSLKARKMAIEWARDHPVEVIVGNVEGWFRSLLGPARADLEQFLGSLSAFVVPISILVRVTLLIGMTGFFLVGAWRRNGLFALLVLSMFMAHILPAGAAGYARFGFPMDAFSVLTLALLFSPKSIGPAISRARRRVTA